MRVTNRRVSLLDARGLDVRFGLSDDDGNVGNESTMQFLRNYMQEYAAFVQRVLTVLPREA